MAEPTPSISPAGKVKQYTAANPNGNTTSTLPPDVFVPQERCENLKFSDLCAALEYIESHPNLNSTDKFNYLFNKEFVDAVGGHSTYPLVRLLIPYHDPSRRNFGLKEAKMIDVYIQALGIPRGDPDYIKLERWKKPDNTSKEEVGGLVKSILVSRRGVHHSNKTLGDVNSLLDRICQAAGAQFNNRSAAATVAAHTAAVASTTAGQANVTKSDLFRNEVINVYSPDEQKWLVRMIFAKAEERGLK
jgi:hypothetical protein